MRATILGTFKGTTKTGRDFMRIYATKEFADYDRQNNIVEGVSAFEEFTYNDYPIHPGDVVDMSYEPGFQGRADLTDIVIVKPADKPAQNPADSKK